MTFNEIRRMAKGMGVNTYRMKKTDLVRGFSRQKAISSAMAQRESTIAMSMNACGERTVFP